MTIVQHCSCINEYQDKHYGKGQRLMNRLTKAGKDNLARCTSCGKEVSMYEVKKK